MRQWFENLLSIGFTYGYFPEPSKTVLIVQSYDLLTMNDLFCDLGIRVVTSSYLGGLLEIMQSLVAKFVSDMVSLFSATF